jgi:hypothetical protein
VTDGTYASQGYEELGATLRAGVARLIAERDRRRRKARALALTGIALVCLSGLALAAATYDGSPAPDSVRKEIAGVDAGMPAALRLNPDVHNARSVAGSGASTLWVADLADGGRCLELTTTYYPDVRAPGCSTGAELDSSPISATLPNDETSDPSAPVVIAGHVEPPSAVSLSLELAAGRSLAVAFGAQRFYVVDLTGADAADVRAHGVTLVADDAAGTEVARITVPADWDATGAEVAQATTSDVTTRSDDSDLTRVLGIDGVFRDPKPASLELVYGDDASVAIAIASDGSFHYDVPHARQGDFMTPQRLVGRDGRGRIVVERQVAAVAFWRSEGR